MRAKPVALAVGALATLASGAIATGVAPPLPSAAAQLTFVLAAVAGAGVAALGALDRTATGPTSAPLPGPDGEGDAPVPGDDVDRRLERGLTDRADREAVSERMESVGARVLARRDGCSADAARERLAAGTWTNDERAARFLADERQSLGVDERLKSLLTGESALERDAARAVAALVDRVDDSDGRRDRSQEDRSRGDRSSERGEER